MLPFLYEPRESAVTFANPGDGSSFLTKLANAPLLPVERDTAIDVALNVIKQPEAYRDLFNAAAKQTEFVDNAFARDLSREEAYDRRIKAVKDATGIALENPERWGYQQDAKRAVRNDLIASGGQGIDETGGIPAYRRRIFDQKLAELRTAHPDKSADLTFGNIDAEGRAIAKGAEDEYTRARSQPNLDPAASLVTEFAGGMWGMRRDPLMVGSLFFGPTSAVGKAVAARIASAGLFQGLYNAGLSAIEQPAVQAWRDEVGLKSGVVPAVENVGLAFLFGAIPGAAFRGIHEAARVPVKRVMEGRPEPGDAEVAIKAVGGEVSPQEAGAIKLGEEMDAAAKVTQPAVPKDVTPELHDTLTTAAQRYADDPVNQPSPAAVEAIHTPEQMSPEISARVAEANPQTQREAQMAASEAIEDIGTRQSMAQTRIDLERYTLEETFDLGAKPAPASSKDPLDKIPMARDDGTPTLVSARQAAKAGERETQFADLIRECK